MNGRDRGKRAKQGGRAGEAGGVNKHGEGASARKCVRAEAVVRF